MACKTSFELYHNFPKLAEESGFTFNTHRPRVHIEWNRIRLVDIESLIRERKFVLIEQHVNDILDCILESEFDVRILDEGVLKIFRLAQLAVEYHQFCRHYLDRSVFVLREEVSALAQELEATKRLLKEKEEEIRKLRKRSRHSFRTPLPYGNDNIATMILKTLNNKADIFPTLAASDTLQHNKCTYCDKVFLNQLYLESHMARRHANITEIPQKDTDNNHFEPSCDKNNKLINEVTELKSKLADMEKVISNFENTRTTEFKTNNDSKKTISKQSPVKEMKDVEVSTNGEGYILDKISEWKKEEHEKYSKELNLLRTQIIAMIDTYKEKEIQKTTPAGKIEENLMTELNATIKQQGAEISALKQELAETKSNPNTEEIEIRKKIEEQMAYWVKRAEMQSNEHKLLLQKLDDVTKKAERSRAEAEAERARAAKLQQLLQQNNEKQPSDAHIDHNLLEKSSSDVMLEPALVKSNHKTNFIRDRNISLQKLQQKAQELLNIENTSTSENSPSSDEKNTNKNEKINKNVIKLKHTKNEKDINQKPVLNLKGHRIKRKPRNNSKDTQLTRNKSNFKLKENSQERKESAATLVHGSPMKIVRAKITEEVNNRLVSLGVDPLKSRLPQNIFIRQKMQLQEQQEMKFKKYPGNEQVLHSLLASLDSHVTKMKKDKTETDLQYNSPNKNPKAFSLSSVFSNVKTKALSLVKTNDYKKNANQSYDSVAKKAMILLRTPPSSTHSSPKEKYSKESPDRLIESQNTKTAEVKIKSKNKSYRENSQVNAKNTASESESTVTDREYHNKTHVQASKSIENLIKSPTRYPSNTKIPKYLINEDEKENVTTAVKHEVLSDGNNVNNKISYSLNVKDNSSDDIESLINHTPRRAFSEENIIKETKGVLKNASSTSSLNKKKVIFDMDAIQMKSVSASSPSQSATERSDSNEKYGLGLINIDNEEWDISSIENEPDKKNPVSSRTSPKIAKLKETIESQLLRRNNTKSTALVGGVDVLTGAALKKGAVGGSNTSLGSSILDDTDSPPAQNQLAFIKPRTFIEKDDSEIDISEFVADDKLVTRNAIKST